MGQYLGIGIVTNIETDKEDAIKALGTEEAAVQYFNERYNPTGVYDFYNEGDSLYLTLNREIVKQEWIGMLKTFYPSRYPDMNEWTGIISRLENLNDPELWLSKNNCHIWHYSEIFFYDFTRHDFGRRLITRVNAICLSLDGKIVMECYDEVMQYFTKLVRKELAQFRLRDAVRVDIMG